MLDAQRLGGLWTAAAAAAAPWPIGAVVCVDVMSSEVVLVAVTVCSH